MNIFNGSDDDKKNQLTDLLIKHKDMGYNRIEEEIDVSSLSTENTKIVFAEVLPSCDFKIYSEFDSTWDMFKNGYIDFNTLVTKRWSKNNQENAFRKFDSEYNKYLNHEGPSDENSIRECDNSMIDELLKKDDTLKVQEQDLKDRINDASNVGILGIIAQFFANLFSKGRTAFQAVSKTRQDRVINNFKPLLSLFKQAEDYKSKDTRG